MAMGFPFSRPLPDKCANYRASDVAFFATLALQRTNRLSLYSAQIRARLRRNVAAENYSIEHLASADAGVARTKRLGRFDPTGNVLRNLGHVTLAWGSDSGEASLRCATSSKVAANTS